MSEFEKFVAEQLEFSMRRIPLDAIPYQERVDVKHWQDMVQTVAAAGGVGSSPVPWAVTVTNEISGPLAFVRKGRMFDGLLSSTELVVVIDAAGESVADGDLVCIEYTYLDHTMKIAIKTEAGFDPILLEDVVGGAPGEKEVTKSYFPLARVVAVPDSDPAALVAEQFAVTNLAHTLICYDGRPIKYFLAI